MKGSATAAANSFSGGARILFLAPAVTPPRLRPSRAAAAKLKRGEVSYAELARRLNAKGFQETEASITSKLGTFAATFFLASLAEIGCEIVRLEDV